MPYFFVIVALLVIVNFYFLFKRGKRSRNIGEETKARRIASEKYHDDLVRKLDHEQEDAARRVDLQNRTFDMYDLVRKQAEEREREQKQAEKEE